MNRKVVYNSCYGGFCLSPIAIKNIYERKHPLEKIYFYVQTGFGNERKDKMDVYEKVDDPEKLVDYNKNKDRIYCVYKDFGEQVKIPRSKRYLINEDTIFYQSCIYSHWELERHDPDLVAAIEELGSERASGTCSKLEIENIGDSLYHILDHDGRERVETMNLDNDYWK